MLAVRQMMKMKILILIISRKEWFLFRSQAMQHSITNMREKYYSTYPIPVFSPGLTRHRR